MTLMAGGEGNESGQVVRFYIFFVNLSIFLAESGMNERL